MSIEGFAKKPKVVQEAAIDGDRTRLQEMGRNGAKIANEKRQATKDMEAERQDRLREMREKEEADRLESANLHILDEEGRDPNLELDDLDK